MIELKHQKKVVALILGVIVVLNSKEPSISALVFTVLSIVSFCISTCASLIKRTPYEKSINSPRYCTKDKFEIGGTMAGYVLGACALLTFAFNKETTLAWIFGIGLLVLVVIIATILNMKIQRNNT
ncbi:hypothetical protein Pcar_3222 [Syntrophotalea carbinolica DSM 2380]|uniref:Uncharacterized protein n=1 Tax=Syntrophotalea carbinolica (strain DSM 2380 / NBRC 103641 / GraBd1) TaxID=338963 RepID=Q0C6U5_SYNC1|nr:hypothetical protein Pcar_3222 [Syntrophotalea carbinolica DSM 2380]